MADGVDEAHRCHVDGSGATWSGSCGRVDGARAVSAYRYLATATGCWTFAHGSQTRHRANTAGKSPSANPQAAGQECSGAGGCRLSVTTMTSTATTRKATAQTPYRVS
jgi:hypothetical protein